jgi:hypothetical protein
MRAFSLYLESAQYPNAGQTGGRPDFFLILNLKVRASLLTKTPQAGQW